MCVCCRRSEARRFTSGIYWRFVGSASCRSHHNGNDQAKTTKSIRVRTYHLQYAYVDTFTHSPVPSGSKCAVYDLTAT